MRALQLTAFKTAPSIREVPEPEPGPGQVVLRVGGAGMCHSDLHLIHDFEPGLLPYEVPFTLGHENAGWVDALGPGVTGVEVGEPVAVYGPWGCGRCYRCRTSAENYCEEPAGAAGGGLGLDGGMAEKLLVPDPRLLVPIGDLDPVDAAPLTDAALTPYHAVKRSLHKLGPGATAVVIGAGGLGHLAVQILAAVCAAQVVVVDRDPDALELAASVGAHRTVTAGAAAADEVRDATQGRGADVVIDLVGSDDTLALAAGVTRALGDVSLVGLAGGSHTFSFFTSAQEVSFASTYWGSATELMEVISLARHSLLKPHVNRISLDEAPDAYIDLHEGRVKGRTVVVPA